MIRLLLVILLFSLYQEKAFSKDASSDDASSNDSSVEKVTKDYWSRVSDVNVDVVQNRQYSKRHRVELNGSGGILLSDPFLNSYLLGGSAGYHFNEFFSLHGAFKKAFVTGSSASDALKTEYASTLPKDKYFEANTNMTNFFTGLELRMSLAYGKVSFLGKFIQYFDSFIDLGAGVLKNESDIEIFGSAGLGSQLYVSRSFSVFLRYQSLHYFENKYQKIKTGLGGLINRSYRLSNNIFIGVGYLF